MGGDEERKILDHQRPTERVGIKKSPEDGPGPREETGDSDMECLNRLDSRQ